MRSPAQDQTSPSRQSSSPGEVCTRISRRLLQARHRHLHPRHWDKYFTFLHKIPSCSRRARQGRYCSLLCILISPLVHDQPSLHKRMELQSLHRAAVNVYWQRRSGDSTNTAYPLPYDVPKLRTHGASTQVPWCAAATKQSYRRLGCLLRFGWLRPTGSQFFFPFSFRPSLCCGRASPRPLAVQIAA